MSSRMERRISDLEARLGLSRDQGDWCPACVHEQRIQVIVGDEPPQCCPACGHVLGPLDGTRMVRIVADEDDPQ